MKCDFAGAVFPLHNPVSNRWCLSMRANLHPGVAQLFWMDPFIMAEVRPSSAVVAMCSEFPSGCVDPGALWTRTFCRLCRAHTVPFAH